MNPFVMDVLDWWARADWRRWFPPALKVTAIMVLLVSGGWSWIKSSQMSQYSLESIELSEEIERARVENITEREKWTSLPPREFQGRVTRFFEEVQRNSIVSLPSVTPYPSAPGFTELDPAMWRTTTYGLNVGGAPLRVFNFFQMVRSEPLIVEVVGLRMFRPEENPAELAATAVMKVGGMGWPIQTVPRVISSAEIQKFDRHAKWFSDPKSEVEVVVQKPKTYPAWKLTGLAGRSVYLTLEDSSEKKILGQGENLYGWTIEISDGPDAAEAVLLKKGRLTMKWLVGAYFNGVEVKKR